MNILRNDRTRWTRATLLEHVLRSTCGWLSSLNATIELMRWKFLAWRSLFHIGTIYSSAGSGYWHRRKIKTFHSMHVRRKQWFVIAIVRIERSFNDCRRALAASLRVSNVPSAINCEIIKVHSFLAPLPLSIQWCRRVNVLIDIPPFEPRATNNGQSPCLVSAVVDRKLAIISP